MLMKYPPILGVYLNTKFKVLECCRTHSTSVNASQAGQYWYYWLTNPSRMEGWVDLGGGYILPLHRQPFIQVVSTW